MNRNILESTQLLENKTIPKQKLSFVIMLNNILNNKLMNINILLYKIKL